MAPPFVHLLILLTPSSVQQYLAAPFPSKESPLDCLHFELSLFSFDFPGSSMADYNFGGSEEENAELKKLESELVRSFS
jgi:hypothetical protein